MTATQTDWWRSAVIYQIYPRSFKDSNNDGIGDIPGIISQLDYLKTLGIDAIWLSPVYRSPNHDFGYDIADYLDINPEYGTLADMKQLITEAKKRSIRIIMDLVINHTSDEHPWFELARDPQSPYHDYYIWRKPRWGLFGHNRLPNNWTSFFTGPAWTKDPVSGQYYLHLFTEHQPDLNYHNPAVIAEIEKVMNYWLDLGIAGFRCDVINLIYKESLHNGLPRVAAGGREFYLSTPGTHKIIKQLNREVLEPRKAFTVGEASDVTIEQARIFTEGDELSTVFSFDHVNHSGAGDHSQNLKRSIIKWQEGLAWNTVFFENHDQPRSVSTYGNDKTHRQTSAKMLATMLLTLKGTPFIYQGQEIGMTNAPFKKLSQTKDPVSTMVYKLMRKSLMPKALATKAALSIGRDNARTPMQWSPAQNAGFNKDAQPWLMVNPNYKTINVEAEAADPYSVMNYYKELLELRRTTPALISGEIKFITDLKPLLVYDRTEGSETYRIFINLSINPIKPKTSLNGLIVANNLPGTHMPQTLAPYQALIIKIG